MSKPHEPRTLSMPPEWWRAFDRAANENRQSLSAWLGESGKKRLPKEVRDALPAPAKRGRPKKAE